MTIDYIQYSYCTQQEQLKYAYFTSKTDSLIYGFQTNMDFIALSFPGELDIEDIIWLSNLTTSMFYNNQYQVRKKPFDTLWMYNSYSLTSHVLSTSLSPLCMICISMG